MFMTIIVRSTWHVVSATYQDVYVKCSLQQNVFCGAKYALEASYGPSFVCISENIVDNYIQFGDL